MGVGPGILAILRKRREGGDSSLPPEVQNLIDIFANDAGRVPHDGQAKIAREIYTLWLVDNNVVIGRYCNEWRQTEYNLINDDLVNVPDTFAGSRIYGEQAL